MADHKLQAALAWARRGLRVFPLRPGTKFPYRDSNWTETASADADAVTAMWTDPVTGWPQDHNIGVLCDDLIVVDVDAHNGGLKSFVDLDLPLDTLTSRTPRGGFHLYFRGPNRSLSVGMLGKGIDIRSYHGYVVAPGSEWQGKAYTLETDAPIADAPEALVARLDMPRDRRTAGALVELDKPEALAVASYYLEREAPAAVEGVGGDSSTFRVACHVKDIGLTEPTAVTLMWELWNNRCAPPWTLDELRTKVENAYSYGKLPAGSASPSAHYSDVEAPPDPAMQPDVFATPLSIADAIQFRPFTDPAGIPPRPWIVTRLLMRGVVTLTAAPGGAGKSTLHLTAAAHMAVGRDFAGYRVRGPTRSLVVNVEDDRLEMERRLQAICLVYEIDAGEVARMVALIPGAEYDFKIADGSPPKIRTEEFEKLARACMAHNVDVAFIDPLIETHDADDSDNQGMKTVMAGYRRFAQRAGIAVWLNQHTPKGATAGSADAVRGATAIINSARIALTLFEANEEDQERYSLPAVNLAEYVRLDDAKANHSARGTGPIWFRRQKVDLPNGDEVGVLVPASVKEDARGVARLLARTLYGELQERSLGSATSYEAAKMLAQVDPIYGAMRDGRSLRTVQRRIESALSRPIELDGGAIIRAVVEGGEGKGSRTMILIE